MVMPVVIAMPLAAVAVAPPVAVRVLSFKLGFVFDWRGFRFIAPRKGFIRSGFRSLTAWMLGMLRLHTGVRNRAARAVLDFARVATASLSRRRKTRKCQQSQH